jgi:enediyne biosynthesis protein E4
VNGAGRAGRWRLWALVGLAVVMAGALSSVVRVGRNVSYRISHHTRHVGAFTDVTGPAGIDAAHANGPTREWIVPITGQAWGDIDRDGFVDLYLTDQYGPNTLYQNRGDGTFVVSPSSDAVALPNGRSAGAVFADYDNDGWPDLYVAGYAIQHLFHNEQGRGFKEVDLPPMGSRDRVMGASWADYDNDGWLDFFVATYGCTDCGGGTKGRPSASRLYRNEGGSGFADVTDLLPVEARTGYTFIGAWGDYDDDGRLDLYLAKDVFGRPNLPVNALIHNGGPGCGGWCFGDVSRGSGADIRANAMGIATGDYDNDGDLDLYFSNSGASFRFAGPPRLLRNIGQGRFEDVRTAGVNADAWSWGTEFLDFDSDGWLDLYLAVEYSTISGNDRLFRNRGDGSFADVSDRSGTSTGRATFGAATGDYDNDGRPDLVVGDFGVGYRLFANAAVYGRDNARLTVRLRGAGPVNRDAVGARVLVTTSEGRSQMRDVRIGSSLGGGSDTALLFGLGDSSSVGVSVKWPDGRVQSFTDVPVNSIVDLSYGGEPAIAALADSHVESRLAPQALPQADPRHVILAAVGVLSAVGFAALLGLTLARLDPASVNSAPAAAAVPSADGEDEGDPFVTTGPRSPAPP